MYRHDSWDELYDFALSEYEVLSNPEPIPTPPSALDQLETFFLSAKGDLDIIKVAGAGTVVAIVLVVLMRILLSGGKSSSSGATTKKKQ